VKSSAINSLVRALVIPFLIFTTLQMSGIYRLNVIGWLTWFNILIGILSFYAYGTLAVSAVRERWRKRAHVTDDDSLEYVIAPLSKLRILLAFIFLGSIGAMESIVCIVSFAEFLPGEEVDMNAKVSQIEKAHSGRRFCTTNIYLNEEETDKEIFVCFKHFWPWVQPLGSDEIENGDLVLMNVRRTMVGNVIEHISKKNAQ